MANSRSKFVTGTVIDNKKWTDRLYSITIRAEQLAFKAGQFIRLQLNIDGEDVAKPYSLVNAPGEPCVEVYYSIVPDGQLSNALAALQTGDKIDVSQPANGFFVLDELPESEDLWMFATGTGLGPYISMLKTADLWKRYENIVLVHGVPLINELVYSDQIEQWRQNHPKQFRFISCVTRELNPLGLAGRMTELLSDGALEKEVGLDIVKESSHIMLCGNESMIKDMRSILEQRDMKKHFRRNPGHITTEKYF